MPSVGAGVSPGWSRSRPLQGGSSAEIRRIRTSRRTADSVTISLQLRIAAGLQCENSCEKTFLLIRKAMTASPQVDRRFCLLSFCASRAYDPLVPQIFENSRGRDAREWPEAAPWNPDPEDAARDAGRGRRAEVDPISREEAGSGYPVSPLEFLIATYPGERRRR